MQPLTASLRLEQASPNTQPVVKIGIRSFGHPGPATNLRFGKFDWIRVHRSNAINLDPAGFNDGLHPACAPDGSLVIWKGSTWSDGTVYRFENPDFDTDFSSLGAETDDIALNYVYDNSACIISNPTTGEMARFKLYTGIIMDNADSKWLQVSTSTDNGINWTAWTNVIDLPGAFFGYWNNPLSVTAAYKDNGDICVVVLSWNGYILYDGIYCSAITRESGTWAATWRTTKVPCIVNWWYPARAWYYFNIGLYAEDFTSTYGGVGTGVGNIDIVYDEDWFVTIAEYNDLGETRIAKVAYLVYGDGHNVTKHMWYRFMADSNHEIKLTDMLQVVDSWNDWTGFTSKGDRLQDTRFIMELDIEALKEYYETKGVNKEGWVLGSQFKVMASNPNSILDMINTANFIATMPMDIFESAIRSSLKGYSSRYTIPTGEGAVGDGFGGAMGGDFGGSF